MLRASPNKMKYTTYDLGKLFSNVGIHSVDHKVWEHLDKNALSVALAKRKHGLLALLALLVALAHTPPQL